MALSANVGDTAAIPLNSGGHTLAKPTRRRFTAEYRLRVLEEADRCTQPGEVGRLLRREGLYGSHLSNWRRRGGHYARDGATERRTSFCIRMSSARATSHSRR